MRRTLGRSLDLPNAQIACGAELFGAGNLRRQYGCYIDGAWDRKLHLEDATSFESGSGWCGSGWCLGAFASSWHRACSRWPHETTIWPNLFQICGGSGHESSQIIKLKWRWTSRKWSFKRRRWTWKSISHESYHDSVASYNINGESHGRGWERWHGDDANLCDWCCSDDVGSSICRATSVRSHSMLLEETASIYRRWVLASWLT